MGAGVGAGAGVSERVQVDAGGRRWVQVWVQRGCCGERASPRADSSHASHALRAPQLRATCGAMETARGTPPPRPAAAAPTWRRGRRGAGLEASAGSGSGSRSGSKVWARLCCDAHRCTSRRRVGCSSRCPALAVARSAACRERPAARACAATVGCGCAWRGQSPTPRRHARLARAPRHGCTCAHISSCDLVLLRRGAKLRCARGAGEGRKSPKKDNWTPFCVNERDHTRDLGLRFDHCWKKDRRFKSFLPP